MEDIIRFTSLGNYSQSRETKEICIFVANDDDICSNIVASMLKYCTYEAFKYDSERDAMNALWGRKGGVEVVLTNIYRTEPVTTRMSIIEHIEQDFNLTTFLMLPDGDKKIESKGLAVGAIVYYVKNMSQNVIKSLYINSLMEMKGKIEGNELVDSAQRSLISQYVAGTSNVSTSSSDEENWRTNMQKRKEQDDQTRDDSSEEKRPRIVWNDDMHKKFLDAIELIGFEKAAPKKIAEVMNDPGLTRENIASHLQKYRILHKQVEENLSKLLEGRKLRNNVTAPPSHVGVSRQPHQLGSSRNTISTPNSSSGHPSIFSHEASSTSNSRSQPGQAYTHFDYARVMDFGRMQKTDQLVRESQDCRFYDNHSTKNILSSIANRWSGNNATSFSTSNSPCIGPRLINGGKSTEFGNFCDAGITRGMGFSAGGNFGNFVPFQEQDFGHGKNFIPLQESPPPMSQLQISNIENSLLISQQEQYIGNHDSSGLGNCSSLQESVPLPQLQVSNTVTSLPPLYNNNGNGPISNLIPQQEQYFGANGNDDSDWTLDFEAIDRLLELEKSLPPLSGELAWNEAAAVQQQPLENEASVPPMVALPSESNSLRIYGGNCITENEAAAPPLVGFEQNSFGVDAGGLEALLQETESPQLFWEDIFDEFFST